MVDDPRGGGLAALSESLLEPAGAAPAAAVDARSDEPPDQRSLLLSLATLLFSIPALIGA